MIKQGKTFAALLGNAAVESIRFYAEDGTEIKDGTPAARCSVYLKDGYASPPGPDGGPFDTFRGVKNAHEARLFVEGARQCKEGYHWARNARFGGVCEEADNTPFHCSVSSEGYWCN